MSTKIICIDPGHCDKFAGACNGDQMEHNDVLKLALLVEKHLKSWGHTVFMTRIDGGYLDAKNKDTDLYARPEYANEVNADYFLSIHRNSSVSDAATGNEIWIHSCSGTTGHIQDESVAQSILDEVNTVAEIKNRGVLKGYTGDPLSDYAINRLSTMTSGLLELGFISNSSDNDIFNANIDSYGLAIAKGICKGLNIDIGEIVETGSTNISITNVDGTSMSGVSCIVSCVVENEIPLNGDNSVISLNHPVGTVVDVSFTGKEYYNAPAPFSYTVTAEPKEFEVQYNKGDNPSIPETDAKYFGFDYSEQTIINFNHKLALADGLTQIGVPSKIGGVDVLKIKSIFYFNNDITHVNIPDTISLLNSSTERTYRQCDALISANIPIGTTILGATFAACINLEQITIPDTVVEMNQVCYMCHKLIEVNVPNSVRIMKMSTFSHCKKLRTVNIGSGIETIDYSVFNGCTDITININRPENSVAGVPWGAKNATINWLG